MEELLSKFLWNGTKGSPDEAITERVVEEQKNPESDNREVNNQEAITTTNTDNY